MIILSDRTHLSNCADDKKEWPVWMTIPNLLQRISQMPSTHSIVVVALLPIPIKDRNIPPNRQDEQQQTNREVPNKVLWLEIQPVTLKHNPSTEIGYYKVFCADGNIRRCKPVLAAWLADCPHQQ